MSGWILLINKNVYTRSWKLQEFTPTVKKISKSKSIKSCYISLHVSGIFLYICNNLFVSKVCRWKIPVDRIERFPHALETQLDKNDHGDIGIWGWPNILLECLWLLYKSHLTNIFSAERIFLIINFICKNGPKIFEVK